MMRSKNLSRRQTRLHASFHPIPSSPLEFILVITKNIITAYLLRIRLSSSILLLLPPHSSSSSSLDDSSSSLNKIYLHGLHSHSCDLRQNKVFQPENLFILRDLFLRILFHHQPHLIQRVKSRHSTKYQPVHHCRCW